MAAHNPYIHPPAFNIHDIIIGNSSACASVDHQKAPTQPGIAFCKEPVEGFLKRFLLDRFEQIAAGTDRIPLNGKLPTGCEKYKCNPLVPAPNLPCRLHTIHKFHINIQKYQVVTPFSALKLIHQILSTVKIGDLQRFSPFPHLLCQQLPDLYAVCHIIIANCHLHSCPSIPVRFQVLSNSFVLSFKTYFIHLF